MQEATRSTTRAERKGRQPKQDGTPNVAGIYWTLDFPQHWIVEADGEVWVVPAFCGGWSQREPYAGPREGLRAYTRRTETIIRRLLCP